MTAAGSIVLRDCRVGEALRPSLASVSFELGAGEAWGVVGPSGGGKEALAAALAGMARVAPNEGGSYRNDLAGRTAFLSFEAASALVAAELAADDSDYVEGGVSEGTPVRLYLAAALAGEEARRYPGGEGLEGHELAVECGVERLMDRGLRRLSTGECRRVMLCRALLSRPALLAAVEPYQGLDAASRAALAARLEAMAASGETALVLVDEAESLPASVAMLAEVSGGALRYAGPRAAYAPIRPTMGGPGAAGDLGPLPALRFPATEPLVELRDVTVSWSGRVVLDRLSWTVHQGEHWLVRGPNGSGKTTLLELISGDNPQAYREDVRVFGRRRGAGQSVWELRARLGLVSYRLHLEHRRLGSVTAEEVVASGLRDSIGLYGPASDGELEATRAWLRLAGFEGRGREAFGRMSYGEQRTLLVARAAIKEPELLVLDEPCHGLDGEQRRLVLGLLDAIAARGRSTILHVTHDPLEARPFERRVLELRPGSSPAWAIA